MIKHLPQNIPDSYFGDSDKFTNTISEKSLDYIINLYHRSCVNVKLFDNKAITTLCPHDIAKAKQWHTRKDSLQHLLRLLLLDSQSHDEEDFFSFFENEPDDMSVILKDKTSN